ncbi:MAG TPA: HAD-IIIA family hydrolase [Deltaproteobacteria bacterium]|nr:HAD-IIIA family hydrolase [Deltaproteobacteria bacterium]
MPTTPTTPTVPEIRGAVFLDRDGTLNHEVGPIRSAARLRLLEGAGRAVRRLNRAGRPVVVLTNQAMVARGDCSENELEAIHRRLRWLLREEGARLDGLYCCLHHPDWEAPGVRSARRSPCGCRKPATGLAERAAAELALDLGDAWMIGDSTGDLKMARDLGIRSVLVRTGHGGRDGKWPVRPDFTFDDLEEAVDSILDVHDPLARRRPRGTARPDSWKPLRPGASGLPGWRP